MFCVAPVAESFIVAVEFENVEIKGSELVLLVVSESTTTYIILLHRIDVNFSYASYAQKYPQEGGIR